MLKPMSDAEPAILVVDDDATFRNRLVKAFVSRGLNAHAAANTSEAIDCARRIRPGRAVVDLRMPGESGLVLVSELAQLDPDIDIIVLTGYGSIATAVEAMRRGALDYMQKPCDADQILAVFEKQAETEPPADSALVPSLARVEWEHIQRVLTDCDGNISEAARRLRIHRRSLQRKLFKLQPSE